MARSLEKTPSHENGPSTKEELSELLDTIVPTMKLEGSDVPSYWSTNVTKLWWRNSKRYQLQVIGNNRNYAWARDINDKKLNKDWTKTLLGSGKLDDKFFEEQDSDKANKLYNFYVQKNGSEYVVTVEKESTSWWTTVTSTTAKNSDTVGWSSSPDKLNIPDFQKVTSIEAKDSLDKYTFLVSPNINNEQIAIIIKDKNWKKISMSPLSLKKEEWKWSPANKTFIYKKSSDLPDWTSLTVTLSNNNWKWTLNFVDATKLKDEVVVKTSKKVDSSTSQSPWNSSVVDSGVGKKIEVTPTYPKISPYVFSSDGSKRKHVETDAEKLLGPANGTWEVVLLLKTPWGNLRSTFSFFQKNASQLWLLTLEDASIKSNVVDVNWKKYSLTLRNIKWNITSRITLEASADVIDDNTVEIIQDWTIERYTWFIEWDNKKLRVLEEWSKERRIWWYYPNDIDYSWSETLKDWYDPIFKSLYIKQTGWWVDNIWKEYKIARKRDYPTDLDLGKFGDVMKKISADKEAVFTIKQVREEFTHLWNWKREWEIPSIDHPWQTWKIRVTLKREEFAKNEFGNVMKVDIVDVPEHLNLAEEDEILQPHGIVWMKEAKVMNFAELPTMWKGPDKKQIRWYQKWDIEYTWSTAVSTEKKEFVESFWVSHQEDIVKFDNKEKFGVFAPRIVMGVEIPWVPVKICEIDFDKQSRFKKIPWGWEYTTVQNGSNKELILKILTREENLTQMRKWPVFKVEFDKISDIEINNTFDLDLDDFPNISQALKDAFGQFPTVQEAIDWLKKVAVELGDETIEVLSDLEKLRGESGLKINGIVPTHYQEAAHPMNWVRTNEVEKFYVDDWGGSNDIEVYQDLPWNPIDHKIFTINYPSNISGTHYSWTTWVEDMIWPSWNIISWVWRYELHVTKVMEGSTERDVLRVSVQPPQDYIDALNAQQNVEAWLDDLVWNLERPTDHAYDIWSSYNNMRPRWRHKWVDIPHPTPIDVKAAYDGDVVYVVKWSPSYWNYIVLKHEVNWKKFRTLYAHLDERQMTLNPLDEVDAWEIIAKTETRPGLMWANVTWPHLHFELRVKDTAHRVNPWGQTNINDWWRDIDPEVYLEARNSMPPTPVVPSFKPSLTIDTPNTSWWIDCIVEINADRAALQNIMNYRVAYTKSDGSGVDVSLSSLSNKNSTYDRVVPDIRNQSWELVTITWPWLPAPVVYTLP